MTKRLNSKHKVDRRLKVNLWGRPKSPFNTRAYGPGQHGQTKTSKPSDYGIQLQAKQKLKAYYAFVLPVIEYHNPMVLNFLFDHVGLVHKLFY